MSREIVSPGAPFSIAYSDRSFGARAKDVLQVSGDDGSIAVATPLTIGAVTQPGVPTVTVAAKSGDTVAVTFQARDGAGNALAGLRKVFVWVSATAGATSVGTSTTGLTTAVTTGIQISVPVANLVSECLTDATGKLVVTLTDAAGTETRFVNFAMGHSIVSSTAVVTT